MRIWQIRREGSFPTQFYGQTYEGVHFYGRYRHGELTVYLAHSEDDDLLARPVLCLNDGTGDGIMEIDEFIARVRADGSVPELSSLLPYHGDRVPARAASVRLAEAVTRWLDRNAEPATD